MIVEDDFNLICFDVVSDPSAPGAFIKPVTGRSSYEIPVIGLSLGEGKKNNKLHSLMNEILRK